MNIIFVTSTYYPKVGGLEVALRYLSRELKLLGCNVIVFTGRNPVSLAPHEVIDGISVYREPMYLYRGSLLSAVASIIGMPLGIFRLWRLVKKNYPCIVHVHTIFHNAVCVEILRGYLKWKSVPIIITFHGGDEAPLFTEAYKADNQEETHLLNWTARQLLKYADAVTAVSTELKDCLLATGIECGSDIEIINNGIDSDYFSPDSDQAQKDIILAVGRLTHQKGFDLLIRAFAQVHQKHKGWLLYIAGDGSQRNLLMSLSHELNVANSIRFPGSLSSEKLVEEMRCAKIVVFPSRYEGFGLVILEAMACGKALISTNVGVARDVIVDGHNGILIQNEDIAGLTNAMIKLIENPTKQTEIGLAARQSILSKFSWEKIAEEYLNLYRQNLNG